MAGGGAIGDVVMNRGLSQTPTWAVSLVCAVIVIISIALEKTLHKVGEAFREKKKFALVEALEKIKGELMVLGFISLILTFGQNYITRMCIPEKYGNVMLPCEYETPKQLEEDENEHRRRLLWYEHRMLAADSPAKKCAIGTVPLISVNGLHQLHIFIFFLAIFHVIFSATTMSLGRMKIREWKAWEQEVLNKAAVEDNSTYRFARETSFVKGHSSSMTENRFLFYIVSFFRHMFSSVRKADYLTVRKGFISVHLAPGSQFNFQKYIKRSLEDDFKRVVGIPPLLWTNAVLFLLLNVKGWQAMFWISIMPLVTILAVGTKLQSIISNMAVEIQQKHAVVQGIPLVQLSDNHFWFGWPQLVLHLIHLTQFQNAFEITYFIWITYEFGVYSCFHSHFDLAVIRVCIGIGVQFMCSYITLPLYALVTQMGSHLKKSVFDEHTSKALMNWHKKAKKKMGESQHVTVATSEDSVRGEYLSTENEASGMMTQDTHKSPRGDIP
ncbi:MLO-like protein 9 [Andrographis paniculata]|uniref:MLO-like protein 9 n=1 Tax=Andrographis paniculata TaxID=175694 RepID=UPI0021E93B2B|nr:MLO-like protein 9 [Andrographis paniculata]